MGAAVARDEFQNVLFMAICVSGVPVAYCMCSHTVKGFQCAGNILLVTDCVAESKIISLAMNLPQLKPVSGPGERVCSTSSLTNYWN